MPVPFNLINQQPLINGVDKNCLWYYNPNMKNLPVGMQVFRDLIQGDYLYVDKTEKIYELFAKGGRYYFLSRPRRFGKSLLISTLAELFAGNKDLFKGLWIYDKIQWAKHPVLYLDLSKISYKTPEILEKALDNWIEKSAADYDVSLELGLFLKEKFDRLLEKLSQNQKVVLLIDEYDKPIIEFVEADDIEIAQNNRNVLKNFYNVIKSSGAYLRFVFITGVSKFSKVSVFSDLNNLRDITLSRQFATLLGYSETELQKYFLPYLDAMAHETGVTKKELKEDIRQWYDGYSWDGKNFVYNPFSILSLFTERSFENYWFSTGTPGFLIQALKKQQSDITGLENLTVGSHAFDSYDIENMEIAPLLFQTGYLTIKQVHTAPDKKKTYRLSYPNKEVRESFLTYLFREYTVKDLGLSAQILTRINTAIEKDDLEGFIREIKSLFASIPYHIFIGEREAYYHTVIYLVLILTNAVVEVENPTNTGRIDAVLETENKIIIMEFKMGSARSALEQIKQKNYREKYLNRGKELVLMGIGFDAEKRNIGDYLIE